jgi:type I restriction enzyme, R subunit
VVWHTQGSGKSITMTCFAARVMQDPAMANPTIVVITDRNDLDGQLFGVFSLAQDLLRERRCRPHPAGAAPAAGQPAFGRHRLRHHPEVHAGRGRGHVPGALDRRNIVVICRRGAPHQYGFEAKLKTPKVGEGASFGARAASDGQPPTALHHGRPRRVRAARIQNQLPGRLRPAPARRAAQRHLRGLHRHAGVSSTDRDTRAVFGDYIHVYDMQQAKEDGATVAIYYESRLAKLEAEGGRLPLLDDEVDELAEDEEESARQAQEPLGRAGEGGGRRAAHGQRGGRPGGALRGAQQGPGRQGHGGGHEPRDLRPPLQRDRQAAPDWHSDDPEGRHQDHHDRLGQRQGAAAPHIYSSQVKKRLEKRFKDPADPLRLVIVRDMWLTGFDAPACTPCTSTSR